MVSRLSPGCQCCGATGLCDNCSGTAPSELTVVISGMTTGTGCGGAGGGECCSIVNATYTSLPNQFNCVWNFQGDDFGECSYAQISKIRVQLDLVGSDYILSMKLTLCCSVFCSNYVEVLYSTNLGTTQPDCSAWSSVSLSHDTTLNDTGECTNLTGLTVEVTAV